MPLAASHCEPPQARKDGPRDLLPGPVRIFPRSLLDEVVGVDAQFRGAVGARDDRQNLILVLHPPRSCRLGPDPHPAGRKLVAPVFEVRLLSRLQLVGEGLARAGRAGGGGAAGPAPRPPPPPGPPPSPGTAWYASSFDPPPLCETL